VTPARRPVVAVCHVLREDESLAGEIPVAARDRAANECIAAAVVVPRGPWSGYGGAEMPGGIGLLVLSGLLIRRVGVSGRFGAELLGEGDLLRPWQGAEPAPPLSQTTAWRVLEITRVAVLDHNAARRFARYPELTGALAARALERSRSLAIHMAIVHQARVHIRVHMLLWHLASRWGQVRPDGMLLRLPLTHDALADLVAAQRPTVSSALAELDNRGLVLRSKDRWMLPGRPPEALLELGGWSIAGASTPS
jgi:CRP/FNR family transcriptional regulator, cyclic AMP receptor protein